MTDSLARLPCGCLQADHDEAVTMHSGRDEHWIVSEGFLEHHRLLPCQIREAEPRKGLRKTAQKVARARKARRRLLRPRWAARGGA